MNLVQEAKPANERIQQSFDIHGAYQASLEIWNSILLLDSFN